MMILMAPHDDNEYTASRRTHPYEGLSYRAPRYMRSRRVFICLDWVLDPLGPGTPMGWALRLRLRLTSRLLWAFLWMGVKQGKPWTDVDSPNSWKEYL